MSSLTIFCHDEKCRGHAETAGHDPEGACRFCGHALVDEAGGLIVEAAPEAAGPVTSLSVLAICEKVGHMFEGAYVVTADQCRGRCARCSVAIVLDGSS